MVRTPVSAQVIMMLLTATMLPIQLKLRASNWMPGWPSAWSAGVAWLSTASTVPSLGATL